MWYLKRSFDMTHGVDSSLFNGVTPQCHAPPYPRANMEVVHDAKSHRATTTRVADTQPWTQNSNKGITTNSFRRRDTQGYCSMLVTLGSKPPFSLHLPAPDAVSCGFSLNSRYKQKKVSITSVLTIRRYTTRFLHPYKQNQYSVIKFYDKSS